MSRAKKTSSLALLFGSFFGLTSVAIGALASHALSKTLEIQKIAWIEIGVRYQISHAIVLLFLSLLIASKSSNEKFQHAAYCMIPGIIVFSGSLFVMALTDMRFLGAITPIGGVLMILGWGLILFGGWKEFQKN